MIGAIAIDRVVEISIALLIFSLFLVVFANFFVNSTIETVKERLSNISINCGEIPISGSTTITLQGKTFYCGLNEEKKQT